MSGGKQAGAADSHGADKSSSSMKGWINPHLRPIAKFNKMAVILNLEHKADPQIYTRSGRQVERWIAVSGH